MEKIKISVAELKKALNWIEANTQDLHVILETDDNKLSINTMDKLQKTVKITVYSIDSHMMPKITKTDIL